MRISDWAQKFNISVTPFDAVAAPPHGATVYRIKDVFTTRDGSWDVSDKPGSLPQWARDEYLRREFDDAGADRHIFGRVLGEVGRIHYLTHTDNSNHVTVQAKSHSGWANIPMYASSSFVPERGEQGPWAWAPDAEYVDVVIGAGLPANQHVSWFAVWTKEVYQGTVTPPIDPPTDPTDPPIVSPDVVAQVWRNRDDIAQLKALMKQWVADS